MGTWLVPAAPPPFASMLQVLAHRSPNAPPTRNACVRLHCAVTEKQAIQTSVSVTTPHCITPRNSASSALHCMVQVSMHSFSCSLYTRNTAVAVRQRRLHKLHCTHNESISVCCCGFITALHSTALHLLGSLFAMHRSRSCRSIPCQTCAAFRR